MAEYWIEYPATFSEIFSEIEEVNHCYNVEETKGIAICIYAKGNDINDESIDLLNRKLPNLPIIIKDTTFTIELKISSSIPKDLTFENCQFGIITITGRIDVTVYSTLSFVNCKKVEECYISNFNYISVIIKDNCNIKKINFSTNPYLPSIEINDSSINQLELLGLATGENRVGHLKISNSNIQSHVNIFYYSIPLVDISETIINDFKASISEFTKINIWECLKNIGANFEFKNCKIRSSRIYLFLVSNSHFEFDQTQIIYKIDFKFIDCINSTFRLNQCHFSDEVNFSDSDSVDKCINIHINETVFKELVVFNKNQSQKLIINNSLFQNGVMIPISETINGESDIKNLDKINSSVWCVMKNQALERNDKIKALVYRKHEMNSYANELNINNEITEEKIVLWLNKFSNNHGLSWSTGVIFTVIAWLSFYFLYTLSEYNFSFYLTISSAFFSNAFWSDAINFLWLPQGLGNLTDKLREDRSFLSSISMVLTFVLGKIAIAYGIYQTISAFRKHGKI